MSTAGTVRDFMAPPPFRVGPDSDIHTAIQRLVQARVSGVPVVNEVGELVGYLSEKDCFRVAFRYGYYQHRGGRVSEYMSSPAVSVNAGTDIFAVAEMFMRGPYRRLPVVAEGRVVGIISRADALKALLDLG